MDSGADHNKENQEDKFNAHDDHRGYSAEVFKPPNG
jgi:hypothetical protein